MKRANNKIKRMLAVGLCVSLISVGFAKNVKGAAVFYAIAETQERSRWCWVASARGVARGETTVISSQADGVFAVKGSVKDEEGTSEETKEAVEFYSPNSDFVLYNKPLSFNQVKVCIDNGHLVLTLFDPAYNTGFFGHAMFIIGYNTNDGKEQVRYCDPADGSTKWYSYAVFGTIATTGGTIFEYTESIFCRLK